MHRKYPCKILFNLHLYFSLKAKFFKLHNKNYNSKFLRTACKKNQIVTKWRQSHFENVSMCSTCMFITKIIFLNYTNIENRYEQFLQKNKKKRTILFAIPFL